MLRTLRKLDEQVARVLEVLVAALLAVAASLGAYQVLVRFIIHQPSTWSEALTRTLLTWMVCLGAALAVRVGALVAFDVLKNVAGGRFAKLFQSVGLAFCVLFFMLLTYYGYLITDRVRFQNLAGLEVSIAWAYAALPVGGALSALSSILSFIRVVTDKPAIESEHVIV